MKSSKRLINQSEALIERGRKRIDKSQPKKENKKREKVQSPKVQVESKLLKRVKSSDTLLKIIK